MSDPTPQPAAGARNGASQTFLIGAAAFVIAAILAIGMLVASLSGGWSAANAAKQEQNIAEQLQKIGAVEIAPASAASAAEGAASAPEAAASAPQAAASQ